MKQVTLNIPDKKYSFFMELVKNLGFVKDLVQDEKGSPKEKILQGIRQSVKEVNLIKAGKLKGIPAKELLREL